MVGGIYYLTRAEKMELSLKNKKEIIKAESDTRKADKGEDKEPESSRESYDDININFESSGKVVEEESIVNTQSNGIVNMFRRF